MAKIKRITFSLDQECYDYLMELKKIKYLDTISATLKVLIKEHKKEKPA